MSQIDLLNSSSAKFYSMYCISYELQILIILLSKITAKTTERESHSKKKASISHRWRLRFWRVESLWTGLVILIWKLFSMSGYRKYINCIWFWHRNPNFGLKKSLKAKKGHKGQWRPAKAKKVQNSKNL